jgi:hypothetical protein
VGRAAVSRRAVSALALVKPGALVFVTARGLTQSRRNALRALHKAREKAKLNPGALSRSA